MPTRVLYWNIRDFARNKIDNPNSRKRKRGSTLKEADASTDRYEHILWLIDQVAPDIFVLVETETAYDAPGRLVRGNGGKGARTLLTGIRAQLNNNNWMLVPPLQTGPNEGVSVFYDSTNRYFTGPFVWPGGGAATAQPPGGGTGNYPNKYRFRLPNRVIPGTAQHNAGVSERRVAARTSFVEAAAAPNPGVAINYNAFRAPYMATFTETPGGVYARDISLFAIHAPASFNARQYLRDLADNAQVVDGIGATEVRIITGDFNVNLLRNNLTQATPYNDLILGGYTLALAPLGAPPAPTNGYEGYYSTHLAYTDSAEFWSTLATPSYYPAYGYTSETDFAIDNIYVMYGGGIAPPAPNNFTIMNAIAGSPYNFVAPPPGGGGVTIGTIPLAQEMLNPPVVANPANLFAGGVATSFRAWEQYGHIYSVSDHLALAIDI